MLLQSHFPDLLWTTGAHSPSGRAPSWTGRDPGNLPPSFPLPREHEHSEDCAHNHEDEDSSDDYNIHWVL